ncbi:MAG: hypothetical protein CR986_05375 [Ignavibacteriae bacterium]|nr:MAG: hypothetical protein CR986_05375 [Ignavibacteriota bacterium]
MTKNLIFQKVTEVKKVRNNVYVKFCNSEQLIIPYEIFTRNYLAVDDELSSNERKNLEEKIEIFKIKQSSFRYLSRRNHSKQELKLKLLKKKYDNSLIDNVLLELEEKEFLNDRKYVEDFFKVQQSKKKGLLKIKASLFQKGVDRNIIEKVINNLCDEQKFLESAKIIAQKKIEQLSYKNYTNTELKKKIYQFLLSRGFTGNIILEVINELKLKETNEQI